MANPRTSVKKWLTALLALAIALFALAPLIGILGSSVSTTPFWSFPPRGFTLRWYEAFLRKAELVASMQVSIYVAIVVAIAGAIIALLIALPLARATLGATAKNAISILVLVPLLVPAVSLGVAIYGLYSYLDIPVNFATIAAAQIITAVPLVVGLLVVGLGNIGNNVERAAANLGAPPATVYWRITLPLLRPALISAGILAFVRSLDDAAIALFLTSPTTMTLPVRMLVAMENESGSLVAATGSVLLIVAFIAAVILDRTIGIQKAFGLKESVWR